MTTGSPSSRWTPGVGRRWSDDDEQRALRMRVEELRELAEARG
jgi:hypothetical protein